MRSRTTDQRSRAAFALAMCAAGLLQPARLASAGFSDRAVVSWDGDCFNQLWSHFCGVGNGTTNWSGDTLPSGGDDVSIPASAPVVQIVTGASANTISCESGLLINSSLQVANGGTIRNLTVNSLDLVALGINGELTLQGTSRWSGRAGGNGVMRNAGLITGAPQITESLDFLSDSTANVLGMQIGAGATAVNSSGATFNHAVALPLTQGTLAGSGPFTNHGDFYSTHHASSTLDIACPFFQNSGTFNVVGATTGLGTRFIRSATFTGGEMNILNNGRLRFQDPGGVGAIFTFAGLPAITGNGSMHIEAGGPSDFRIASNLDVNLTGSDGLVLAGTNITLTETLRNQANAKWIGGRLRQNDECGFCVPEFRNEGTLLINSSGVTLDTWLRNNPAGTITHQAGGLLLGDNGLLMNEGEYVHHQGTIARQQPALQETGTFDNRGTYRRPDHPLTQNADVQAPFVLNDGQMIFEKATTTFGNALDSGLHMLGGEVVVLDPAVVRIGQGTAQNGDSLIAGDGKLHLGGLGGTSVLMIEGGVKVQCAMGASKPTEGLSDAALVLDPGARIAGQGELVNLRNCLWNGGGVGHSGAGHLRNAAFGGVFLASGQVLSGGLFTNDGGGGPPESEPGSTEYGVVGQSGTLTLSGGLVRNHGQWNLLTASTTQGFGTHQFINEFDGGFICATPSAHVSNVSASFSNIGLVEVRSGTLNFTGPVAQVIDGVLAGGFWSVHTGGVLDLPGTLLAIGPGAFVRTSGAFLDLRTIVANFGSLNVNGVQFNQSVLNRGTFEFGSEGDATEIDEGEGDLTNEPPVEPNSTGGWIDGFNTLSLTEGGPGAPLVLRCANLNNNATVRPGGPNAPGPFSMDGNFNQTSSGTLQIEFTGPEAISEHDQLIVDGNVVLDGYLHVRMLPGFTPSAGQQFTIITAVNGTISGTFDQVTGYGQYSFQYSPSNVTLTVVTPPVTGDINGDGIVDVFDLLAVIIGWGLCPPQPAWCAADLNGDGVVNVLDLLLVILNWG